MKKKLLIVLIILLLITISTIVYLNTYYKASDDVKNYLKSSEKVEVKKIDNVYEGYLFDGPGTEDLLVFYPGGKVEYTAYAPLMNKLAENGLDTIVIKMPFNLAITNINIANKVIISNYKYENYYLGGHSLGGVAASSFVNKFDNLDIKGLVLLGAYSTKKIDVPVLSIYGSKDGVLNIDKYKDNKSNITNLNEVIIEGGNHANFGNYGNQKGDNKSTISKEEQQERTVLEILKFIKEN